VVVSRQRPPTARGKAFLALEDEGGLINVALKPETYEASRRALRSTLWRGRGGCSGGGRRSASWRGGWSS
jgi:hypothetical protein